MCWIFATIFSWLRENEQSLAIWIEGLALVAIFGLELKEYRRQGRDILDHHKESADQLAIMRSQAQATIDNAIAAKDAAEAARISAQAVLNSERAWIDISLQPPEKDQEDDYITADIFECSIQIENHGRTVARIESVQIGSDCTSEKFSDEPQSFRTINLHSVLGSGQKEIVGGFHANDFSEWRSILDGTKRGILRITVKYRDVVDASTVRETTAGYIFQGSLDDPPERVSSLCTYS